MKKHVKREIQDLVSQIPVVMTTTQEFHIVKGSQLIEDGISQIDGIAIDPEREYRQPMPVQIARNHYRRMKKAFKKAGAPGVAQYLLQVNGIMQNQDA